MDDNFTFLSRFMKSEAESKVLGQNRMLGFRGYLTRKLRQIGAQNHLKIQHVGDSFLDFFLDNFWILFGALKLFMALLGPSWLLPGPSWSQNGPENYPRNYPKVVQKMIKKTAPQKTHFKTILGFNLAPFWAKKSTAHFLLAPLVQLQTS